MRPLAYLPCLLLALLAHTPDAAAQTIQHSPDVDVTLPLGPNTSYSGAIYQTFDADWTADGRLAFAVVRRQHSAKWPTDTLVIGLHDPATGDSRVLGSFTGPSWAFEHVALAVPEHYYDEEGTGSFDGTTPIHDQNRVFVALGAEAPVWPSWDGNKYQKRVRVVRLLSVSFTDETPKLSIASPPDLNGKPVPFDAEPPCPELALRSLEKSFAVELVFVDPHSTQTLGGQVMGCTSYDLGATLGKVCYVTGPCSPAAGDEENPLAGERFARPVLGFDDQGKGRLLMALADVDRGVVHLAATPAGDKDFEVVASTPEDGLGHHAPRMAVRLGQANVTYLVGQPSSKGVRPLDWFSSSSAGGYVQHKRITELARTSGDIEVRGNTAFVVVRRAPDQGSISTEVASFDLSRTNPFDTPSPVRVNDMQGNDTRRVVSATTPEYAQLPTILTAVFRYELGYTDNPSGLLRDD